MSPAGRFRRSQPGTAHSVFTLNGGCGSGTTNRKPSDRVRSDPPPFRVNPVIPSRSRFTLNEGCDYPIDRDPSIAGMIPNARRHRPAFHSERGVCHRVIGPRSRPGPETGGRELTDRPSARVRRRSCAIVAIWCCKSTSRARSPPNWTRVEGVVTRPEQPAKSTERSVYRVLRSALENVHLFP